MPVICVSIPIYSTSNRYFSERNNFTISQSKTLYLSYMSVKISSRPIKLLVSSYVSEMRCSLKTPYRLFKERNFFLSGVALSVCTYTKKCVCVFVFLWLWGDNFTIIQLKIALFKQSIDCFDWERIRSVCENVSRI